LAFLRLGCTAIVLISYPDGLFPTALARVELNAAASSTKVKMRFFTCTQ